MRATLINHRYWPYRGGSEIYIQRLSEWLASGGTATRVVTTDAFDLEYFWDPRARPVGAPGHQVIDGVSVERTPVRHYPLSRWLFPIARRGMGEASRLIPTAWPYRLIATHLPSLPELQTAIWRAGRPDFVIAGNLGLEGLAISAFEAATRMSAKFVLFPFAHIGGGTEDVAYRYVSMPHQRELVQRADMLVALTEIEATFLERIGADPGKIVVAGAGVDVPGDHGHHARECSGQGLPFSVLSLGALAEDKGTKDLVEASRILHERGCPHQLTLAGPELSEFEAWFRATGADACDWIRKAGIVSDDEKNALLANADVVALPSRTESFGIVYLEGWSHCKPVVGASVGAVSEVIAHEEDGLLVPFGEPHALADALERLEGDRAFARSLGQNGYKKVIGSFTWDKVFARIELAFREKLEIELNQR